MDYKDVTDSRDLQIFLQEQAEKQTRLYHYTTLENILCIIKNKCFRLTRMDLMNDKAEKYLGKQKDRSECYVMSLTKKKEYISMWAMYGRSSGIKLRLGFNRKMLWEAINENFFFDNNRGKRINLLTSSHLDIFSKAGWLLSDIVYLDKNKHLLKHNGKTLLNITHVDQAVEDVAGFVKYDAWEFEKETRLRVNLRSSINDYKESDFPEHIYAGINEKLIQTFRVTFSPWLSSELKDVVRNSLREMAGFEIPCQDSENDGEISEL